MRVLVLLEDQQLTDEIVQILNGDELRNEVGIPVNGVGFQCIANAMTYMGLRCRRCPLHRYSKVGVDLILTNDFYQESFESKLQSAQQLTGDMRFLNTMFNSVEEELLTELLTALIRRADLAEVDPPAEVMAVALADVGTEAPDVATDNVAEVDPPAEVVAVALADVGTEAPDVTTDNVPDDTDGDRGDSSDVAAADDTDGDDVGAADDTDDDDVAAADDVVAAAAAYDDVVARVRESLRLIINDALGE